MEVSRFRHIAAMAVRSTRFALKLSYLGLKAT
jgi:hypothetical protein